MASALTGIPTFIFELLNKSTKESLFKLTGKALDDAIKAINKSVKGANRKKDVDKTKLNKEANDIIGNNKTGNSAPANQNTKSSSSQPANQNTKSSSSPPANQNVASSSSSAPKPANQNVLGPSKVSGGGKTPTKTPNYNKRGALALGATLITAAGAFNFNKVKNFLTGGEDKEPNKNVIDKFFKGKPRIAKKRFLDELERLNKKSGRSGDSRTNAKRVSKKASTDKDRPPADAPPLPEEKPTPPKEIDDKKIARQKIRESEAKASKQAKRDKILKEEGDRQQGQIPKKKAKKEGRFSQGKKTIKTPFGNLVADSTDEGMSKFMGTKDEIRQQMEDEEMNFRKGGMARAKAFGKGGTYKSPKKNYTNGINMRYGGATKRFKGY